MKQNGYVTLLLVTFVGLLTATIVGTVLTDAISSTATGLSFSQTYKARSDANTCVEVALYKIHNGDVGVPGSDSDSLVAGGDSCAYTADVSAEGNITIDATGTSGRATVAITVVGTVLDGAITIEGWE